VEELLIFVGDSIVYWGLEVLSKTIRESVIKQVIDRTYVKGCTSHPNTPYLLVKVTPQLCLYSSSRNGNIYVAI